jgi:hypothetical protein
MLAAMNLTDPGSVAAAKSTSLADVFRGMFVTLRYKLLVLRSSLYGIAVGVMPGVGASVSVWLAYAHAARSVKSETPFGQGAIAGVIAPEAANNSKEGGAMIPTLFFGIPGSSSMAIMMAALAIAGVSVGPNMLGDDLDLTLLLGAAVILANLFAIPMFCLTVPWIVKLSALRREMVAPFAIAIALTATLVNAPNPTIHFQLILAATIGLVLKQAGWPRAPFILGFVLGGLLETSSYQTAVIWGWSALWRPMTMVLLGLLLLWVIYIATARRPSVAQARRGNAMAEFLLVGVFLAAIAAVWNESWSARQSVGAVCGIGIAMIAPSIWRLRVRRDPDNPAEPLKHVGATLAFLVATPFLGILPSSAVYLLAVLCRTGMGLSSAALFAIPFVVAQFVLLAIVFDIAVEKEVIGRLLWTFFWR